MARKKIPDNQLTPEQRARRERNERYRAKTIGEDERHPISLRLVSNEKSSAKSSVVKIPDLGRLKPIETFVNRFTRPSDDPFRRRHKLGIFKFRRIGPTFDLRLGIIKQVLHGL